MATIVVFNWQISSQNQGLEMSSALELCILKNMANAHLAICLILCILYPELCAVCSQMADFLSRVDIIAVHMVI